MEKEKNINIKEEEKEEEEEEMREEEEKEKREEEEEDGLILVTNTRGNIPLNVDINKIIEEMHARVKKRNILFPEFIQSFSEVFFSLKKFLYNFPVYIQTLEALAEPDRFISFRVPWFDDQGNLQINSGYRVQYSSALGPYKGGLRFTPSVNLSIIKFLGFEQTLKNSLTGLSIGGAKGGADFNPKGKSIHEIRRFCQSFMSELHRHIGPNRDIPAGDIGVSTREIGYLFGYYKKIKNKFNGGVITGKDIQWGGSEIRQEATGYGCAYFAEYVLKYLFNDTLEGKSCIISGCGNVAIYCAEKIIKKKGKVLTLSDSKGVIYKKKGFNLFNLYKIKQKKKKKIIILELALLLMEKR